jgi:hypothetical protein
MKLGITVVYLVPEGNEELLDLHLSQIEKNTEVPYLIYAAANRLAAPLRDKLQRRPTVRICELPDTESRGTPEHAFYLDRLVVEAIQDGVTHVCTLHLDSFPIRTGWAMDLTASLTGNCVLAGLVSDELYDRKPNTAFMLFTREFYLLHRPTFLLPAEVLDSERYREYSLLWKHQSDSGVGYGFKIFSAGLTWIPLSRTDKGPGGHSFGIFGDVVFHLGGAVSLKREGRSLTLRPPAIQLAIALDRRLGRAFRALIPRQFWVRLSWLLPRWFIQSFSVWRMKNRESELAANPDGFLQRLRTGRRL